MGSWSCVFYIQTSFFCRLMVYVYAKIAFLSRLSKECLHLLKLQYCHRSLWYFIAWYHSRAMFLNPGDIAPQGTFGNVWGTFLIVTRKRVLLVWREETRLAAKNATVHRTAPQQSIVPGSLSSLLVLRIQWIHCKFSRGYHFKSKIRSHLIKPFTAKV